MREILFRGKHIHILPQNEHLDGRWIEGYLVDKDYINSPELEGEFLIDPETVCQYTGLTDKNGRKIFEGDIVRLTISYVGGAIREYNCKVSFGEFGVLFENLKRENDVVKYGEDVGQGDIEVVGNIFDNPKLIG